MWGKSPKDLVFRPRDQQIQKGKKYCGEKSEWPNSTLKQMGPGLGGQSLGEKLPHKDWEAGSMVTVLEQR